MPRECEGLHANLHSFFTIRSPLCLLLLRQLQRRASVLLAFSADARSLSLSPCLTHSGREIEGKKDAGAIDRATQAVLLPLFSPISLMICFL